MGLIRGSGERIFSAGWDLKEVAAPDFDPTLDAVREDAGGRELFPVVTLGDLRPMAAP